MVGLGRPETQYVPVDGVDVAWQVLGDRRDGVPDLIMSQGSVSNIEVFWENPDVARLYNELAAGTRLILFDRRGFGASERFAPGDILTSEEWADDYAAVIAAAECERAVAVGVMDAGPAVVRLAARRPPELAGIVLIRTAARATACDGYPIGPSVPEWEAFAAGMRADWGTDARVHKQWPEATDPRFIDWARRYLRSACSPRSAFAMYKAWGADDVRHLLAEVAVPALVIGRDEPNLRLAHSEYLAAALANAELATIDGQGGMLDVVRSLVPPIHRFLGVDGDPATKRASILFTDIVDSTRLALEHGDQRWDDLLDAHDRIARSVVRSRGGTVVKSTGDGTLCIFDRPSDAAAAASDLADALSEAIGLQIRAGAHHGEVVMRGDDVAGVAVHVAARVAAQAGAGVMLVTDAAAVGVDSRSFVGDADLILKGLPGTWHVRAIALLDPTTPPSDVIVAQRG